MVETVTRKRIEILVDVPLKDRVTQEIDKAGITGWTVLPVQSGRGHEGDWNEDHITGSDKVFVITICNEAKAFMLRDALAPILSSHSLLFIMSDIQVVRGEHF